MSKSGFSRRTLFRKAVDVASAAAITSAAPRILKAQARPKVYSAFNENLVTGTAESDVQENWVRAAVDACVKTMTGQNEIGAAWQAVFPGITATKKIAIKINCLNIDVHPQWATVVAIVRGLCSMFNGTYPPGNISLFDNNLWVSGKVDACFGAANLNDLGIVHSEDTYASGQSINIAGKTMHVSRFLVESDYGISLAKMSPHQFHAGGLSGVIKNMMGTVSLNNTAVFDVKDVDKVVVFHAAAPFTAFRDLFSKFVSQNLHLYIVDMLFACRHENEIGWAKVVKRITMGTDPCAVDSYNVDAINALNMDVNKPVTKAVPQALANAGLGSVDYELVEPPVSIGEVPIPTRVDLDLKIRDAKAGSTGQPDVKTSIKGYRQQ